jgi:hypothetical protein
MKMQLTPVYQKEAFAFIKEKHRHHVAPVGSLFQVGVKSNGVMVGVAVVGRVVARKTQQQYGKEICEVTRLCTDGTENACSKLYAACARIAREMGYKKIQTFILKSETGISLKASGWIHESDTPGKSWSVPSRKRDDKHPIEPKEKWSKTLNT